VLTDLGCGGPPVSSRGDVVDDEFNDHEDICRGEHNYVHRVNEAGVSNLVNGSNMSIGCIIQKKKILVARSEGEKASWGPTFQPTRHASSRSQALSLPFFSIKTIPKIRHFFVPVQTFGAHAPCSNS
jgi:hypothetical protein